MRSIGFAIGQNFLICPLAVPDVLMREARGRIFTIMGGSTFSQDTIASIKAYQRKADSNRKWVRPFNGSDNEVTFHESETNGLDRPHNDPLVITLTIGDFDVERVLVYKGSTLDIIFHEDRYGTNHIDSNACTQFF